MGGFGRKFNSRVAVIVALMMFISILNFYMGVLDVTIKNTVGNYIVSQLRTNGISFLEGSNGDSAVSSHQHCIRPATNKSKKNFEFNQKRVFGNFYGFDERFAVLNNAVLHPALGHGKVGGEEISAVRNQSEEFEYWTFDSGYFTVECQSSTPYTFKKNTFLAQWMRALRCRNGTDQQIQQSCPSTWTLSVTRTGYVNLYISMVDLYNVFLMIKKFDIDISDLTVLWIDGHPKGSLDDVWKSLFGRVIRVGALTQPTLFNNLIWCPRDPLPIKKPHSFEEFRTFFLNRHSLSSEHKLNCSHLNITVVWRRDYLAHPRKMNGFVERKIANEDELIEMIKSTFPSHHVIGVQLDKLDMTGQLRITSSTDIFVGMHGAGLTHTMFLSKTSALLEMFPMNHGLLSHMHQIAQARNLRYAFWRNKNKNLDKGKGYTHVNVNEVRSKMEELHSQLCNSK